MAMNTYASAAVVGIAMLTLTASACDQDPFGVNDRTIVGDYELYRFPENDRFYIHDRTLWDNGGGGVLEGYVLRIGWDEKKIVAWRRPLFGGDEAGWMVIDVVEKKIIGPLREVDRWTAQVNGIAVRDVEDAWRQLR